MHGRTLALALILSSTAAHLMAADLPIAQQLQSPDKAEPLPLWKGLYAGTATSITFSQGKSRFGGEGFVGYDRKLDDHFLLNVQGSTGYAPALVNAPNYRNYSFIGASTRIGYQFNQITPYVLGDLQLDKPDRVGLAQSLHPTDALDDIFRDGKGLKAHGGVGLGVNYEINEQWSVSAEARLERDDVK